MTDAGQTGDAAVTCEGHIAVGTWTPIDTDGSIITDGIPFTFSADCTFSGRYSGKWSVGPDPQRVHINIGSTTYPTYVDMYFTDERAVIDIDGQRTAGMPGSPSGTEWMGNRTVCCANGSAFTEQWTLALDADGTFTEQKIPTAAGPIPLMCSGTWQTKPLGFATTVTAGGCTSRQFVWLDPYIGPGYQRQ